MRTILLALVLLLSGCSTWNTLQGMAADRGAAASDEAQQTAEFVLCRGITIGAWLRAYGNSVDKARAWQTICGTTVQITPKGTP